MKNTLLIISIFYTTLFFSQERSNVVANEINIVAKYNNNLGMELRWFPSSRSLFKMGIKNGYVLERADFISKSLGYSSFKKIKEIKPYTENKWDKIIRNSPNKENNFRELAHDFVQDTKGEKREKLIFNGNTSSLKKIKHQQENEFSFLTFMTFQDKEVAVGIGLGTTDNTVIKGKKYLYRVVVNQSVTPNKTSLQDIVCKTTLVTAVQQENPVNKSIGIIEKDSALSIIWENTPDLVGYYIERSDNGVNYNSLTKTPLIFLKGKKFKGNLGGTFEDKNLINGKEYFYKVYANTLFGEKVLVGMVKGTPKDLTPPKTPYLENPKHNKDKVELTWKFINTPSADLKGFNVYQSNKHDGEYVKLNNSLLHKNKRTFNDSNYSKDDTNYYKVIAYDNNDNASSSMPAYALIIDDTPPKKPKGIVASISKDGVVQIVIPKQNNDDIIGYKIFKANQEDHEFSVVEEVFPSNREPLFDKEKGNKKIFTEKVPLKTLTLTIFYKVKMYDKNFNQSEFSDIIKIVKPDVVPPAKAIIKRIVVNIKSVQIELVKPASKDLKKINLYRKEKDSDWKLVYSANKNTAELFLDKNVAPNKKYDYRVQAVDENGLKSDFSPIVSVKTINYKIIKPIEKITVSKEGKQNIIRWKYINNNKKIFVVVYRKSNNGVLKQLGHSSKGFYIDKRPPTGKNYYTCLVVDKNGNRSVFSNTKVINN